MKRFLNRMQLPVEEVAGKILEGKKRHHLFEQAAGPTRGVGITPPQRITVFNGSPRGRRGNTPILLGEFMQGFGGEYEMYHLVRVTEVQEQVRAFAEAECVWFGFKS